MFYALRGVVGLRSGGLECVFGLSGADCAFALLCGREVGDLAIPFFLATVYGQMEREGGGYARSELIIMTPLKTPFVPNVLISLWFFYASESPSLRISSKRSSSAAFLRGRLVYSFSFLALDSSGIGSLDGR